MIDALSMLLLASLATPLAFLGACFVKGWRRHGLLSLTDRNRVILSRLRARTTR